MENKKERNKKAEYIAAVIFNLIFLFIVNNLLNWNIYFITTALNEVLWIVNLSIIAAIIGMLCCLPTIPNGSVT